MTTIFAFFFFDGATGGEGGPDPGADRLRKLISPALTATLSLTD